MIDKNIIMIISIAMIFIVPGIANAIPGIPCMFYGDITYSNGETVEDGLPVSAQLDGNMVSSTTTENGSYSLIVTDEDGTNTGEIIRFYVDEKIVDESGVFQTGGVKNVNISLPYSPVQEKDNDDSGSGTSSGTSGSSSFGTIDTTNTENEDDTALQQNENKTEDDIVPNVAEVQEANKKDTSDACVERWLCTDWSSCDDQGMKTRDCEDVNSCGTDDYRPHESEPCDIKEIEASKSIWNSVMPSMPSFITGNAILGDRQSNTGSLMLLAIAAVLIILYIKKDKLIGAFRKDADMGRMRTRDFKPRKR